MSRPTREQVAEKHRDVHYPQRPVGMLDYEVADAMLALFPEASTADAEAEADARYNRGDLSVGEYLFARDAFVAGAAWQAQQPREVVTTVEERDDLIVALAEANAPDPAVILAGTRPYILTENDDGDWWAWSYQYEDEEHPARPLSKVPLPFTVIHRPEGETP